LAVPLLIMWGKRRKRPSIGLWAALLLTLSPFHLRYSQEARHYTWLMLISLATYVALERAMARPQWKRWLIFAVCTVVNVYIHYAALVVLASQAIMIVGWIGGQWRKQGYRMLVFPGAAALVVLALYAPWLSKLWVALNWNLGHEAGRGNHNIVSGWVWLREIFFAFGAKSGWLPYIAALLALAGAWQLVQARRWRLLGLVGGGIILPVALISLLKVSRWALVKYVIYLLPPYLLAISIALDAIFERVRRYGRYAHSFSLLTFLLILLFIGSRLLYDEYQYIQMDWKGIADYLGREAQDGDIVATMTLDMANGFNQGSFVLPYYLERGDTELFMLSAHVLNKTDLDSALQIGGDVWIAVLNRQTPMNLKDGAIRKQPFQTSLYALNMATSSASALEQLIYDYEQLLPLAKMPSPRCLLKEDLALLQVMATDYSTAERLYIEAKQECPSLISGHYGDYDLPRAIYHGLMAYHQQQDDMQSARRAAGQLLALNAKDEQALEMVTAVNLLQEFTGGAAQINKIEEQEAIQIHRYAMPHNGDWGDVLMIRPPNSLSYQITLPDEPTDLQFRAAMAPESWDWGGDGATFMVAVGTDTVATTILFQQHISNNTVDRDWHEVAIPLTDFTGQTITLTLATDPGPNGDFTGDWAGWETPRIVYQP
ncbi:MAG: hypothetical protein GY803_02460, partial [Chloroflexi bacterium]|nr:hypothetical protein [Chloroflexota bacterium]